MNEVESLVTRKLQTPPPPPRGELAQVSVRIDGVLLECLDAMAARMHVSRTNLAAELLEAAIIDGGRLVGIEVTRDPETGEQTVARFMDPRDQKGSAEE